MKAIIALAKNDGGATAIEYGLIAGLIAVTIIGAVTLLGGNLSSGFGATSTDVSSALPSS